MSAHLFIECPCGYFVPVDFESTGGVTAGLRPARITYPHLQSRGLQIPEDIVVITGMITNTCPCGFAIHRVVNCGSATRCGVLFISSLHEQRRNRTKEETRRLLAKKLKIKACFPKLAKRPRSARLNEARSLRKTSSIFYTLFC